jgi:DNA polymerase III epsilon subunit-like protein
VGFYLRKSLSAGPFRFNLSKSGVGVSVGVPGFRVGTGPRGNYVHMGRGGVYYRATLGGPTKPTAAHSAQRYPSPAAFHPSDVIMEDVTGATALELAPTGGGDVVDQLNAAAARVAWGWWATGAAVLIGLFTLPYGLVVWAVLAPVCAWLVLNDKARKTVVLFYDVSDEHFTWFDSLVRTWAWLTGSQKIWRVLQSGHVATTYQFKTNAGASQLINRVHTAATTVGPKQLTTNIAVPAITAGKAALYFLPDRILVRDGNHFSDLPYNHLGVRASDTRFIEDGATPGDAEQVGQTWKYINVKDGPDRRFKNNRVLPIMRYGTVNFGSGQGLHWQLQVSRADAAVPVVRAVTTAPALVQAAAPPAVARPQPTLPKHRQASPAPPPARTPRPSQLAAVGPTPAPPQASKTGFVRTDLTRNPTPYPSSGATFTAIDLETTGLDPATDRIVEIGLVKFTTDGTIVDEFATLVNNPGSNAEARAIHGIEDADLIDAPTSAQVLQEAFAFIAGTVHVAHNLDFEDRFLIAEAHRAGLPSPKAVGLCTLQTSRRQLDGRAFSLTAMYKTATGGWSDQRHTALGDARAVREVLLWLLRNAPQPLYLTQGPQMVAATTFQQCPISCRPVPLTRCSMSELLDSFPQSPKPRTGDPTQVEKYAALLTDAVDDGRLTYEEADALTRQARLTRLGGLQLRQLHQNAWETTYPDTKDADWATLAPVQRREMYLLADALGLPDLAEQINVVIQACAEPEPPPEARYLRGLRIAVVGDHNEVIDLRHHAESYGAKLAVNITKTVKWMVSATPEFTDSRHTTARKLGIPIISPAEGSARLDEAIREAELKAFERQREIDRHTALRQQRANEADAYWRPSWRPHELEHDPEPWLG